MSEEQAKSFLEQATQSLQSGQFQQALELADQAIAAKESDEGQILRGIALSQLNQPDGATDAFRRAISLNAHNPKAYFNLAVHYYALGQRNEALEMAREAVRIDSKHAGARDLVARVEAELTPKSDVPVARVMDDGTTATTTPTSEGQPPVDSAAPQSPYQQPYQQPVGGYVQPGYETASVHSLQFIERMGKGWDTLGWVIVGVALVISAFGMFQLIGNWDAFMQAMQNPEQAQRFQERLYGNQAIAMLMQIVSYGATLGGLTWMILELTDRRGNWLWLLPYVLCCCCTFGLTQPIVQAIYMVAGRQK
jgi:tetratricopeptide (TPR) repeat protein